MKKILVCTSFVLVLLSTISVQAQRWPGRFNNAPLWGSQNNSWGGWGNQWNNGLGNQWNSGLGWGNQWNNNGTALGLAGISALENIITVAIVAGSARSVLSDQKATSRQQFSQTTCNYNTFTSVVAPSGRQYRYYTDWQDNNGNWWRTFHY
jgi:hypothetical protein